MIIFVISHPNHCCDPLSEPFCRDGSDEGSNHYVFIQNEQKLSLIITKYSFLSRALVTVHELIQKWIFLPLVLSAMVLKSKLLLI